MKHITQRAFTIVELIVIIGVIGILTTVAVLGFGRFQNQARDAERQADIGVIVESLEKYYDENGEYPSCSALTAGGATVAQTLDLQDAAVLASPRLRRNTDTHSLWLCLSWYWFGFWFRFFG